MAPPKRPSFRGGIRPGPPFQGAIAVDTAPRAYSISPNFDRIEGAAEITISGENFHLDSDGNVPSIYIDGQPATAVVLVNSQTITARVPSTGIPGVVDVVVAQGSQQSILNRSFTYIQSSISDLSPAHGSVSGGTRVTISGFNFVPDSIIYFGGIPATDVTFYDSQTYSAVTPAHALGFVEIVIAEPNGASNSKINGFQYTLLGRGTDIRRNPGITIDDTLNNAPNMAKLRIDGASSMPVGGERIQIIDTFDNDRLLFAGNVQTVEQIYEEELTNIAWDVSLIDFTGLLNKYRPIGTYINMSASLIVIDLITRFAPGFTTIHVQTNLAAISMIFDGTEDFSTCLTNIAKAIGGGHWYADYLQDMHFFHIIPKNIHIPASSETSVHLGPGNAPIGEESNQIDPSTTYSPGYYYFRSTGVYDNGVETALSPMSNPVILRGVYKVQFSNVAIYPPIGSATCIKRRMYYEMIGFSNSGSDMDSTKLGIAYSAFEIGDNVLTDFTTSLFLPPNQVNPPVPPPIHEIVPDTSGNFGNWVLAGTQIQYALTISNGLGLSSELGPVATQIAAGNAFYHVLFRLEDNLDGFYFHLWRSDNGGPWYPQTYPYDNPGTNQIHRSGTRNWPAGAGYETGTYINVSDPFPDPTTPYGSITFAGGTPSVITAFGGHPKSIPYVVPPLGPPTAPSPAEVPNSYVTFPPTPPFASGIPIRYSWGSYRFSISNLYRDGTESLPGPESPSNASIGLHGALYDANGNVAPGYTSPAISLANVPIGQPIGNVDVITRKIYAHFGGSQGTNANANIAEFTRLWAIIPNNVATDVPMFGPGTGNGPPRAVASTPENPIWPNPDGPSLENNDPPAILDNDDLIYLLREPSFKLTIENSQIRNRVTVVGAGTTVTFDINSGASEIPVADISKFSLSGGSVRVNGEIVAYSGISAITGAGKILLNGPLSKPLLEGAEINPSTTINDLEAQRDLGQREVDQYGKPTDGVHETIIPDTNLTTELQRLLRAYAEIELFARPIRTITYSTRDPRSKSGVMVQARMVDPPCEGEFLIQHVTIDQIHDEADELLLPRYNVEATSVRYEFDDFMLQLANLLTNGSNDQPSTTGLVSAAVSLSKTDSLPIAPTGRRWVISQVEQGAQQNIGGGSFANIGANTFFADADGWWERMTATIDIGVASNSANNTWLNWRPILIFKFRTGPDLADTRFWIGWGSSTAPDQNDKFSSSGTPRKFIGLRYSPIAGDQGWVAVHAQGNGTLATTVQAVLATFGQVRENTSYVVKITVVNTTTWTVEVNGQSSGSLTLHPDLLGTMFGQLLRQQHVSGAASRYIDFSSMYFERDN